MTREHFDPSTTVGGTPARRATPLTIVVDVLRGAMIGMAELVPGVSGGTIALVTGVYERIIDSANHVVTGGRRFVTGPDRWRSFRTEIARAEWGLLIPLLVGMGAVVLTMAGVMKHFVESQPHLSYGLFMGMVAASVAVPVLLVDKSTLASGSQKLLAAAVFLGAAVVAFLLTSQGGGADIENPSKLLVFGAAAIAICALVLPGVSGSFLLAVFGLYVPTMGAVADRDLGYIAVFGAGAIVGLALFVKGLHWLLHKHHTITMVAMSGLMLGSLRALWPWQDAEGAALAPGSDWPQVILLAAVGAVGVMALVYVDRRLGHTRRGATAEPVVQ